MFSHLETLLQGFVKHPNERVSALPVLTEAEYRQIIHEWNDTAAAYPRDRCLHQLFEEQVELVPDTVAVSSDGRETTYQELNERANRLAHHLRGLGVGPGVLAGICIERSADMLVGVLGITKAGGAYVPLDPAYPKERLAFMLKDTQAAVLLTQQKFLERLPETPARVLCLDQLGETLANESTDNPVSGVAPTDLAYIIYTSGSTGQPKGVVLRHGPVVNLIDWVNTTYNVGPGDRLLFVTSLNFDLSVYDIFGILGAGGCVRVAAVEELRDPEKLLQVLCQEPITFWDSAPPQLQQVASFFAAAPKGPGRNALRLVFLSGDWIPVPLPDAIRATFANAQVISLGGATEAAIWSNYYPIGAVDPKWPSIPYGKPIKNARYHVLDKHLHPVPVGVTAELHIGGLCLADGYLNRAELTAEKFIADPFADPSPPPPPLKGEGEKSALSGSPSPLRGGGWGEGWTPRLYKTGDLARYFPDGNLEFLGRMDFQVKIRGFRIELGEIEAALAQHPTVRECLVTALKDESGDRYLCAYVVPRPGQTAAASDLRKFLQQTLPAHMVPPHYVTLDAFPLNPNGKIDRKALPPPGRERRDETATFAAPRNATEKAVAEIWAKLLGVEQVGIHDNFFALGGHSLKATQVVSRIRQELKVELPLQAFFRAPTIAGLCAALPKEGNETMLVGADITAEAIKRARVPASFAQRRLWFVDQLGQDRDVYIIGYVVRIRGPLNEAALRQAFDALVERHHSLRTTFADEVGQPVQVVGPPLPVDLPVIDLTGSPPAEREAETQYLAEAEARQVFDLARGPLWQVKLLRHGPQEHVLFLTMHHIITDGWSMGLLFRDLSELYGRAATGKPVELPPLPVQYTDFSSWQRQWLQGTLGKQLLHWKKVLAGALPVLQLPMSRTRPPTQTFRGALHVFPLPPALVEGIGEVSRQEEATSFMTLLAAFMALLHRYSGQEDILVGIPIANRNRAEIEDVVGFFVNMLPARVDIAGDITFRELLQRVRQRTLDVFAHQDLPFDVLVQELHPDRSNSQQPIFQVLFNYLQNTSVSASGLTWSTSWTHNGTAKFDLTLLIEEEAAGLRASFEYNTDLFDAEAVARMAGHFLTLLEGFVADPGRRLAQLPLLTEAERKQTLIEWNDTRADYPRDRGVQQLFEDQAAKTPERVAVAFEKRQLTYAELNARANQLAHYLKTLNVGPEVLVGLCLERSVEMVVGLLGILKAGGAYVPLDPGFPSDRLAFYVEDSAMPVLITQKSLLGKLPEHKARVVNLDDWDVVAGHSKDNPAPTATAQNLVYVIYTSGSTGKPKGVQVLHGALTNFINSMRQQPGLTEKDVLLAVTTISFDIHALEMWLPLSVGAKIIVVSKDVSGDGVRLLALLQESGATVLQATPATWRLLLAAGWEGSKQLKALCGGEPMTVELAEKLLPRLASLWNMYGPTETTVWSTINQVRAVNGPVPIGRPIDNTLIYLVDKQLNPVPVGVVGELLIGGDGLARGYLNRPELTQEKFIPDTFVSPSPPPPPRSGEGEKNTVSSSPSPLRGGGGGEGSGPRMYRTGDLARYLPDGTIECLGRVDHQVKIRGYRIELGEIETVLGQQPGVKTNVVVARKDESGADYLAAYIIPQPGTECRPDDLRKALQARLPEYMVPSYFVTLESFPLTPNGKIDRKALPAPQQGGDGKAGRTIVPPRDDAQRDLLPIWEEVLKVKPISITDNFFELGGHSFLAAVLIAKIKQQLGHTLPLGTLFTAPTIEKLAHILTQSLEAGTESSIVPLQEEGNKPPLFMIAGVGGHVFTFHKFARLLGHDQPVYGFKAIGVDGVHKTPETIEEMAAYYIREIAAQRLKGPYVLSGYSIGAVVAYELAVQLRALGHKVPALVVFDMFAPGYPRKLPGWRRALLHLWNFVRLPFRKKWGYVKERFHKIWVRILAWTGQRQRIAPKIGVEGIEESVLQRVWVALTAAQMRYLPQRQFDGKVILFKAAEGFKDWHATKLDDPKYGWGRWATGGVEEHTIPGGHMEMFHDKNINLVAAELAKSLG
ncbi:MAG TPA: amino acid adenylation domain-containing protein [Gemmataceae bacterium]|nr:amino acid adenylation domain-containing protein [Gemmataceae bacterium]